MSAYNKALGDMKMLTHRNIKELVEESRKFIHDEITIAELNGYVSRCWGQSTVFGLDSQLTSLLAEYMELVDKAWNEWNWHDGTFTIENLKTWIVSEFLDDDDSNYSNFKRAILQGG